MAQTLINHQGHSFIPIRSDYWEILSSYGWTKTITAAACKVLAVLENWTQFVQDRGRSEVKMSIRQLTEAIKEHGVRTIAKAAQLLHEQTDLITREKKAPAKQQGAWENPALTWWYRLNPETIQAYIDRLTKRSNPEDETLDPIESSDRSEEQQIIESPENTSENTSEINNVSATADFFEQEVDQDELKAMEIDPKEVKQCISRNSFNYHWALFQLKKFYVTGKCENPTGYLMSRLACRQDKSSAAPSFSRECPQPGDRQLWELCEKFGSDNVGRTILNIPEMGYPLTWVVAINEQYYPWWEVWNG